VVITWASRTEIATDNTRANASLDIILSIENSIFWTFLIIINNILIKMEEAVIYITKISNSEEYSFEITRLVLGEGWSACR